VYQQKESLQARIDTLQQEMQKATQQREKLITLQERMSIMQAQNSQLESQIQALITQREELRVQLNALPTQDFEMSLEHLQQVRKVSELLRHLIDTYKDQQHQLHILQEKEKKLSDLVKIL
jgi:predicted  nucleic acid-binding Zn-ribbon protein